MNIMKRRIPSLDEFINESSVQPKTFINEKQEYKEDLGDIIISIKNITKDREDIIADCEMIFDDKNDVQPFLDNDCDNINMSLLRFAEEKKIIKNHEYSVGFDEDSPLKIKGQ